MRLKDILEFVEGGPFNINFSNKRYGHIAHEFEHLYNRDWYSEKDKLEYKKVYKKYKDCEVVELYGFDDGLTIIIKVEE